MSAVALQTISCGFGGGQAALLCESFMATSASAVFSAAMTGLTTGTPTRRAEVLADAGQEGHAHAAEHQHVGAVLLHGDARRLGRLVERAGRLPRHVHDGEADAAHGGEQRGKRERAQPRGNAAVAAAGRREHDMRVPSWAARCSDAAPGPITGMLSSSRSASRPGSL